MQNNNLKTSIKNAPLIGTAAKWLARNIRNMASPFQGSENYWIQRYESGGNSGAGSYADLAQFKAEIINQFVREHDVRSVIEFGSGDGNQLTLSDYPRYLGFDISPKAIALCEGKFANDKTKTFKLMKAYSGETADLVLSLDVIYHLIEDEVFENYMETLFAAAERFVIVYSSNNEGSHLTPHPHVKHRRFSDWIERYATAWRLFTHIPNKYPFDEVSREGSFADFYIYEKVDTAR